MWLNIQPSIETSTQETVVNRTRVLIIMLVVFTLVASAILVVLNNKKVTNQEQHLALISERYNRAYQTIYSQYEQLSGNIFSGLMARFEIQEIYQQLSGADEDQKNHLRQKLLDQIESRYVEMQQDGSAQYLHFHLPNNQSFLRVHQPENFGDNLEEFRHTVVSVNKVHKPISGYEAGRSHGGYRFVYPISGSDGAHLGSMEISFGPEALTSNLMKQHAVLSNFFILKDPVNVHLFSQPQEPTYKDSHHQGYYYNENVLAALETYAHERLSVLKPSQKITDAVFAAAHSGQVKSVYDPDIDIVLTTIPVFNPATHQMTAFCTVRSKAEYFQSEIRHFKIVSIVGLLLLASVFITFYLQYNQRKTLEIHSSNLEDQKSQLLKTQKTLQQERDMFMQGPVMVFSWDNKENWPVTHVSKNVIDILGYNAEEFLDGSVSYTSIVHEEDCPRMEDEVASYSSSGVTRFFHEPYRLTNRSGETIWVLDSTSIVRNAEGEILRYQGYLVDITKMVLMEEEVAETRNKLLASQNEEAQKRQEILKTMAGAIAHRFNNTMMTVGGNLDLIMQYLPPDSNERSMASQAIQAAKSASQVGSMMLSYLGQKTLELEVGSLPALTEKQIISTRKDSPPGITFRMEPYEGLLNCSMDKLQITEVLNSILVNAIDAMEDITGEIIISFGTTTLQRDTIPLQFQDNNPATAEYAYCQIQDSGHGIEPDKLPLVFEPFYTTRFVGRGLGLALTVGIMRAHGGAITLKSTSGTGTTVRLLLPTAVAGTTEISPVVPASPDQAGQLSGKVLFVDDEQLVIDVGRRILERLGFDVQTASSGQEAIGLIHRQVGVFRAVVMDVSMPGMDGFATMKEIRKLDQNLPVLLSSGYSEDDFDQNKDSDNRPDAFLNKPFLLADIKKSLEGILS